MPKISEFYGIVIRVWPREHAPPHFHVEYGEHEAAVNIRTGATMAGGLPPRAVRFVNEWLEVHRTEVVENWDCAQSGRPCFWIEPL